MSVPDYSHDQELLARKIRGVLDEFDYNNMDREDVVKVLEWESTRVKYGDKENLSWIEGLGNLSGMDKLQEGLTSDSN